MTRDHYVDGVASEWLRLAQRIGSLTLTHPKRPRPMAVRRTLSVRQARTLRVRWLAIGCVAGWVPLVLVWAAVRVFGGAP